jgi:hypothetical protein
MVHTVVARRGFASLRVTVTHQLIKPQQAAIVYRHTITASGGNRLTRRLRATLMTGATRQRIQGPKHDSHNQGGRNKEQPRRNATPPARNSGSGARRTIIRATVRDGLPRYATGTISRHNNHSTKKSTTAKQ